MPTRRGFAASLAAGWLAAALLATPAAAQDVTVFAAASLKNALDNVAAAWKADAGKEAVISYAASSALAKQIEQGAPADVFVSADLNWMDYLSGRDLVRKDTVVELLGNRLVLVAPADSTAAIDLVPGFDLAGLLGDGHLAMGQVDSVPAGVYGKAALTSLGAWDSVSARVAQAENVRAALALVSTGEAPLGIVYADRRQRRPEGEGRRRLPRGQPPSHRLSRRRDRRVEGRGRRGLPRVPRRRQGAGAFRGAGIHAIGRPSSN